MTDPKTPRSTTEVANDLGVAPARLTELVYRGKVDCPRNAKGCTWFRESAMRAANILGISEVERLNRLRQYPLHDPVRRQLTRRFYGYAVRERNGVAHRYMVLRHARDLARRLKATGELGSVALIFEVKDEAEEIIRREEVAWEDVEKPPALPPASFSEVVDS